jgi:hypothetical protein
MNADAALNGTPAANFGSTVCVGSNFRPGTGLMAAALLPAIAQAK